jgi:hypothetical protein
VGRIRRAFALMMATSICVACGESPTEPEADINPALLQVGSDAGLAAGASAGIPQGSAEFTGPGGMLMDATGEEFIQQLTLDDGTVWKTSGIYVRAVPDESVTNAPFFMMSFGSALTGSHASVPPGSYTITGEWPEIDFIQEIPVVYGQIRETNGPENVRASGGVFTITSVNYFDDVYACQGKGTALIFDRCDYQLGVLRGTIEMTATIGSGEVVQQQTSFAVPIRRQTAFVRFNPNP